MTQFPARAMRDYPRDLCLMLSGSPPSPPPVPALPPAAAPATMASPQVAATAAAARTRAAAANGAGFAGTLATSPEGLQAPPLTAPATLLGGTK